MGCVDLLGRSDELGESAAMPHQLGVRAGFDDSPIVEDENAVGFTQSAQSVGHQDDRAVGPGRGNGPLNESFTDIVECGSSLIENQDRWVLQKDAGQGDQIYQLIVG